MTFDLLLYHSTYDGCSLANTPISYTNSACQLQPKVDGHDRDPCTAEHSAAVKRLPPALLDVHVSGLLSVDECVSHPFDKFTCSSRGRVASDMYSKHHPHHLVFRLPNEKTRAIFSIWAANAYIPTMLQVNCAHIGILD